MTSGLSCLMMTSSSMSGLRTSARFSVTRASFSCGERAMVGLVGCLSGRSRIVAGLYAITFLEGDFQLAGKCMCMRGPIECSSCNHAIDVLYRCVMLIGPSVLRSCLLAWVQTLEPPNQTARIRCRSTSRISILTAHLNVLFTVDSFIKASSSPRGTYFHVILCWER